MLPTDIKNIIYNYKNQLEHYNKFKYCLCQMKFLFEHIPYPEFYPKYASFKRPVVLHKYILCNEITKEIFWDRKNKKGIIKINLNNLESNHLT